MLLITENSIKPKLEAKEDDWFDHVYSRPMFQEYVDGSIENIEMTPKTDKGSPIYTDKHTLANLVVTDKMTDSMRQMVDPSYGEMFKVAFESTFGEVNDYTEMSLKVTETLVHQMFYISSLHKEVI